MSKRYLMRLGKTPFEIADAFQTLDRNLLGTNSGNLIYGAASHKLLSTQDTVVEANHYRINAGLAAEVNAEYDGFILPLANAFRPEFEDELRRTADFLERLTIPFVMLSGGAQLPLDGDPSALKAMEPTVKRFARAVLNGSSALTVRGEMTADYLTSLGFEDVLVVGCPSLTLHGPGHRVEVPAALDPGAPVGYSLETKDPFGGELIADAEVSYDATYLPQEHGTLEMMLWGTDPYTSADPRLPLARSHPQFTEDRAELFIDAFPWIDRLAQMDFAFGARAHGTIAAVLAGTPGVMLAHDSRTLELARHHGIPHLVHGRDPLPGSVQELYAHADYTEFNRGHAERFEILSGFLHENGFTHIYEEGQEAARSAYEQRIAATAFSPAVRTTWTEVSAQETQRLAVLQDRETRRRKTHAAIRREARTRQKRIEEQLDQLVRRAEEAEQRLAEAERRATAAEQGLQSAQKLLRTLTRQVQEADDRSQRALRIPTRVKKAVTRSRAEP